ncbi:MAG: hypothetical protein K0S45_3983 [Nitrospira sp.]|jgi:hypothetical protein|nr:hypothetical protein [Nitrospira sp.]
MVHHVTLSQGLPDLARLFLNPREGEVGTKTPPFLRKDGRLAAFLNYARLGRKGRECLPLLDAVSVQSHLVLFRFRWPSWLLAPRLRSILAVSRDRRSLGRFA